MLTVSTENRRVTDRQTDRQTDEQWSNDGCPRRPYNFLLVVKVVIALNCLVFETIAFLARFVGDRRTVRQTDGHTNRWTAQCIKPQARYRKRRINKSFNEEFTVINGPCRVGGDI